MSKFSATSPRHCANHGLNVKKLYKRLFYVFSSFLFSALSLVLLIWLLLHPSKPEFYLKEANIYQLNISDPHKLDSSVQITLLAKNPNQKVGIYYEQLQLYASYEAQQITTEVSLPPFYQGHDDSNLLTASLSGDGLPIPSYLGYEVARDQKAGTLALSLKMSGKLRWKVGTWVSARFRFNVDCVAFMAFPNVVSAPLSSNKGTRCSTTV